MRSYLKKGLVLTALGMAVSGCQDLTVPNLNNPERDRALAQPGDVEALIAGTWRNSWNRWQGSVDPSMQLSAIADEMTTTAANWGSWTLSSEPRIPYDNNPTYAYVTLAETPYYNIYDGIANIHDGVDALKNKGIVIDSAGKNMNPRALAFAKFTEGLLRGYLALMYDKAFLVSEDTPIQDGAYLKAMTPVSYKVMMDSAVASFKEAIAIVDANPTINIRKEWLYTATGVNATEFKRLINSYMARYIALNARTPAERAAVDWNAVIAAVDAGITADYSPIGGPGGVLQSNYKYYTQLTVCGTCIIYHADNKLVGPADTSGKYQAWLNKPIQDRDRFDIATPDRRITGAGGPQTDGFYFRYRATNQFRADRGLYHQSNYQFYRFKGAYGGKAGDPLVAIYKAELDLLKAEGLYRKGDAASLTQAATLINKTRTDPLKGNLPAVTSAGVPVSPGCVPRKDNGDCGDLWDALVYEKRIETAGGDAIAFYDARGWGKLVPGTFLHLPIPGRELAVYKMPMYSFGGGGEGSAQ